jgi:2-isopropylmalate synthase
MAKKIFIFDTTLRDGEQAPGIHLNVREKLEIAEQLDKLNVDTIEAGFPISSKSDFNAISEISRKIKDRYIAALARAVLKDVDVAGESLKDATHPVIHTFISSSDIHLEYQFKKTREEAVELARAAVKRARQYTDRVEFSAMDATRSDRDFLCRMYEAAIESGAKILNVPDTVGYAMPAEFSILIDYIFENVRGIENVILSVHCHNDLGLAVANSILAVQHGATQIEVAVNGIGERAGNAALEEIAMIIDTRNQDLQLYTDLNLKEIMRTSSLIRHLTGYTVAPNKAIVGKSVFTHEAGIHQDGMLKHRTTYEIMKPEDIGSQPSRIFLGKHSGSHAFAKRVEELGFKLKDEEIQRAFDKFKDMAEKKGEINDDDLKAIINNEIREIEEYYRLKYYQVLNGSSIKATATVGVEVQGKLIESASYGDGPVDASFKAIDSITGMKVKLIDYNIEAVSEGKDAIGVVKIIVKSGDMEVMGSGISTDIIEASIKSYIDALNRILIFNQGNSKIN